MHELPASTRSFQIQRLRHASVEEAVDALAVEEPLEIRLAHTKDGKRVTQSVSITMRTPGDDLDLAAGFLFTESIVRGPEQIASIHHCGHPVGEAKLQNVVRVELTPDAAVDLGRLQRHFYTSSSCGVCGKSSLDAIEIVGNPSPIEDGFKAMPELIHRLPSALRAAQNVFDKTGGLHAAALFDGEANLIGLREDVGRHNALDKLIGAQLREARLPLADRILLLSGRASFELLQKSLAARIPLVAAVGAPSSLAVDLARRYNITLLGFVREDRFNIYSAPQRICVQNREQA